MTEVENRPSHHYVCFDITDRPDLHITICTLDKLSSLQLLPIIRGMNNFFGLHKTTGPFDCVTFPNFSHGFVREPRKALRVMLPHPIQEKCERFRTAFYVDRNGLYGYDPHITFENLETAIQYRDSREFTRISSISLVNAKTGKRVFTINLGFDNPDLDAELLNTLKGHNDFLF